MIRDEAWFLERCTVDDNGCWVWQRSAFRGKAYAGNSGPNPKPYGLVSLQGRWFRAHRVSYELLVGPIGEGLQVDHLCFNTLCINPAHLEPVTPKENTRRSVARITHCPSGHEYTEQNTMLVRNWRTGELGQYRQCKMCNRLRARVNRARAKEAKPLLG